MLQRFNPKSMMKYIFSLITFFIVNHLSAQKLQDRSDTIITKDPLNAGRELWVVYGIKGNVKYQGCYLNGKKDGTWREYNDVSGIMTSMDEYKEGIKHGASLQFGNNGMITTDETYLNDKLTGTRTLMNNYARIRCTENYLEGILNGYRKLFYDNGKVQEEGNWADGQRNGSAKWYYENGKLKLEYNYLNGKIDGQFSNYDDAGNLKQKGFYKNNIEEGEWTEYPDSVTTKTIIYKNGVPGKEKITVLKK